MQINIDFAPVKRAWTDNPVGVLGVGAAAIVAVAKLLDSVSAAQGRRAYAQQVRNSTKRMKSQR